MKSARIRNISRGFTLVEVMLGTAVLLIFFAAITAMVQMSLRTVGQSRTKTTGQQLLQEKMETIRNMPYVDVGTVGGVPNGVLAQTEVVEINGNDYTVSTDIIYVDDPFDGVAPIDTIPTDYKRVRLSVNWDGVFALPKPVILVGDVTSSGLELDEGGGTLVIQVLDSVGEPVTSANVHIENDQVFPVISLDIQTDVDGLVELPGTPDCLECYEITATKEGFTTDKTYGTEEVAIPNKPHSTVLEGELTQVSFVIDTTTRLYINTVKGIGQGYADYDYIPVTLRGTKEIGRDALDQPVYKVNTQVVTNGQGEIWVENLEWDTYQIGIQSGQLDVVGFWPSQPFPVVPYAAKLSYLVLGNNSDHSLLVRVVDNLGSAVEGVTVSLVNAAESLSQQKLTAQLIYPDKGQAFFENLPETLEPYDITLTLLGYEEASTSATVSGDIIEELILNPE